MAQTTILITGSNQGIGYEVAKQLLSHPNTHILLCSRDKTNGQTAASTLDPTLSRVDPITLDVTDDTSITAAAEYIQQKYGKLDILINNAGINPEVEYLKEKANTLPAGSNPLFDVHPTGDDLRDLFRRTYEVNVFGAGAVTESFIPLLSNSEKPNIIFVSSHTGSLALAETGSTTFQGRLVGDAKFKLPSFPIYRSSKAALDMLLLHYANRFVAKGWRVNGSCPNITATKFTGGMGRPASESAVNIVKLCFLDEAKDGVNGVLSDEEGVVPW